MIPDVSRKRAFCISSRRVGKGWRWGVERGRKRGRSSIYDSSFVTYERRDRIQTLKKNVGVRKDLR